jgi:hypothetical protein
MEFSHAPDESYFAMIAGSPELAITDIIISRKTHFSTFRIGESHATTYHDGDEALILDKNVGYFFARKIDASKEQKLKAILDNFRNNNPFYESGLDAKY